MTQENNAINELMEKTRNLEIESLNAMKQLLDRIEENGTTGDIILDLVLLRHKTFDQNIVDKYRLLKNKLKGQTGQPIMVIRDFMYNSALSGRGKGKLFGAGILDGEKFARKNPDEFCFPVSDHLHLFIHLFEKYYNSELLYVPNLTEDLNPIVLIGEDEIRNCAIAEGNVSERIAVKYFITRGLFPFTIPLKSYEMNS